MALIKKLPTDLKIDFMGRRKFFMAFSILLLVMSVVLAVTRGLNFGVDFRGGILIEIRTTAPADISSLRSRMGALGLGEVSLQEFGSPTDILINIQKQDGEEKEQMAAIELVKSALGAEVAEYRRVEFVGPKVGSELMKDGIYATVFALLGIAIYIWLRYEWQFSVAALLALTHDVIATIGFFAVTQFEFNLATLAAILMIAGYSINDTVVVFDRVRDELRRYKSWEVYDVLNMSINVTLSRTILTSFTTLLALIALFLFGGEVIRGLSLGLIWGIVIGTYSSIAIAVPLLFTTGVRSPVPEDEEENGEEAAGLIEN
ncbi:protein translocase subunit SecF [Kiloniella laminariae]|uniref:protein translocase subunit SecF n=1 Tax=Kiloniella laminariae TaxID=454162 RepID=UPI000382E60B|nr:protein translocase subunit SecF [Kiloniella laminariae]